MKETTSSTTFEVTVTDRTKTTVEIQKSRKIKRIVKNVTVCEFIGTIDGVEAIKEEVEIWQPKAVQSKQQDILERLKNIYNERNS